MEETEGTLYLSQMPSASNLSLISQAKMPGSFIFNSLMKLTTLGVVTLGLLPPMAPGRMEPVSLYLAIVNGRVSQDSSHGVSNKVFLGKI